MAGGASAADIVPMSDIIIDPTLIPIMDEHEESAMAEIKSLAPEVLETQYALESTVSWPCLI